MTLNGRFALNSVNQLMTFVCVEMKRVNMHIPCTISAVEIKGSTVTATNNDGHSNVDHKQ